MPARVVFNALIQRERLGSGGIVGVAIPHAVFAKLVQGVVTITTVETAVAFVAHDITYRLILSSQSLALIRPTVII